VPNEPRVFTDQRALTPSGGYAVTRTLSCKNSSAKSAPFALTLPFARPRDRRDVLEHPQYRRLRQSIIDFLENHAHKGSWGS
jgi:hypothetical protein